LGSSLFPERLRQLPDAPERLYTIGEVKALALPAIAIVGARKATPYGLSCARHFARRAAEWGVAVVSGGAICCDMAAHQGALDGDGTTIVILGSGADIAYPLRAKGLFEEVVAHGGVLVSEAPWGSAPHGWAFKKRNRIIAALAHATLIVEAGLPSGTFQTADHTLALGNEVMVVPGSILSKEYRGSNRLLVQGAIPIIDDESFEDALRASLGSLPRSRRGLLGEADDAASVGGVDVNAHAEDVKGKSEQETANNADHFALLLLRDLAAQPMQVDAIAEARGKSAIEVIRTLTRLEVEGLVEHLRDGRYMTSPRRNA
jgi:DNA processing protein